MFVQMAVMSLVATSALDNLPKKVLYMHAFCFFESPFLAGLFPE